MSVAVCPKRAAAVARPSLSTSHSPGRTALRSSATKRSTSRTHPPRGPCRSAVASPCGRTAGTTANRRPPMSRSPGRTAPQRPKPPQTRARPPPSTFPFGSSVAVCELRPNVSGDVVAHVPARDRTAPPSSRALPSRRPRRRRAPTPSAAASPCDERAARHRPPTRPLAVCGKSSFRIVPDRPDPPRSRSTTGSTASPGTSRPPRSWLSPFRVTEMSCSSQVSDRQQTSGCRTWPRSPVGRRRGPVRRGVAHRDVSRARIDSVTVKVASFVPAFPSVTITSLIETVGFVPSWIVSVAVDGDPRATPLPSRSTASASPSRSASATASFRIGTQNVFDVSPAANASVPDAAV